MSHPGVWGRTIVTLTGMSSLRHPSRLSGIPHVIPTSLTSFRHPSRHPGIPHVIPTSPTSFRHPPRHPGIPHIIPTSPTSSRHPPRHPGIPHVTPASPRHSGIPLSFRHPPCHSDRGGYVDSGVRRKDGRGADPTPSPRRKPGSTSLTHFGCLSGWPQWGVNALSLGVWLRGFRLSPE